MVKVSIVDSDSDVEAAVKRSVDLIGGLSKFIKKGDSVLLKPNYNSDDPPPASTDPAFLKAAIVLLKEAGAKVTVGESSGPYWKPTLRTMERMGAMKVAKDLGVEVRDFDHLPYVEKRRPDAKYLSHIILTEELDRYDKLVYLPCLKTHNWTGFTLALKLCMGFPKTTERLKMHAWNLDQKVAELNLYMEPDLIIMDGRRCFVTGGPDKGDVEEPGVILASADRVAVDIEGVKIIQGYKAKNKLDKPVLKLPLIKHSIEIGIGKPGTVVRG